MSLSWRKNCIFFWLRSCMILLCNLKVMNNDQVCNSWWVLWYTSDDKPNVFTLIKISCKFSCLYQFPFMSSDIFTAWFPQRWKLMIKQASWRNSCIALNNNMVKKVIIAWTRCQCNCQRIAMRWVLKQVKQI